MFAVKQAYAKAQKLQDQLEGMVAALLDCKDSSHHWWFISNINRLREQRNALTGRDECV